METVDDAESSGVMTKSMFLPGAGFAQNLHLKWYVYIYYMASIAPLKQVFMDRIHLFSP